MLLAQDMFFYVQSCIDQELWRMILKIFFSFFRYKLKPSCNFKHWFKITNRPGASVLISDIIVCVCVCVCVCVYVCVCVCGAHVCVLHPGQEHLLIF